MWFLLLSWSCASCLPLEVNPTGVSGTVSAIFCFGSSSWLLFRSFVCLSVDFLKQPLDYRVDTCHAHRKPTQFLSTLHQQIHWERWLTERRVSGTSEFHNRRQGDEKEPKLRGVSHAKVMMAQRVELWAHRAEPEPHTVTPRPRYPVQLEYILELLGTITPFSSPVLLFRTEKSF